MEEELLGVVILDQIHIQQTVQLLLVISFLSGNEAIENDLHSEVAILEAHIFIQLHTCRG